LPISHERPVFILGSGRCGSTLAQSILNSHPDFLIWGEHGGWVRRIADAYYQATTAGVPAHNIRGAVAGLRDQIERLRTPGYFGHWDNYLGPRQLIEPFRDLVRSIFAARDSGSHRWGFKEIRYCVHSSDRTPEFLLECFPEVAFLIVVRNPWDTVFSMVSKWFRGREPLDAAAIDRGLTRLWTQWDRQYRNLFLFHRTAPRNSSIVRFEDILDPLRASELFANVGATCDRDIRPILQAGGDGCIRDDDVARRIRDRQDFRAARLELLSLRTRLLYGYRERPRCSA
jgi:Sulfotransferase family